MSTQGHCLCGKTGWEFQGEIAWACYCHCDDCRRNCAAPIVAWLGVPVKNFQWLGMVPKSYESCKGVRRHFCENCGTPMGFEADHYAGDMHLYAASLEDPKIFKPTFHVNYESKLPWLEMSDSHRKYNGTLFHVPEDHTDSN